MALQSSYRTIGILIAVATIAVIFLVGITLIRNNQGPDNSSRRVILEEPESGLVVIVPDVTWTIGSANTNFFINRSKRIEEIQSQKGTCNNFSKSQSVAIETALQNGPNSAQTAWQLQFPGLTQIKVIDSAGVGRVLAGIDTCNATFNRKVITLRGQAYKNDVEIKFSRELTQDANLSQAELDQIAEDISLGRSEDSIVYNELIEVMRSAR